MMNELLPLLIYVLTIIVIIQNSLGFVRTLEVALFVLILPEEFIVGVLLSVQD